MSGSKEAVELATHLPEIGFPEFTTKLVSDVFDSLIASRTNPCPLGSYYSGYEYT